MTFLEIVGIVFLIVLGLTLVPAILEVVLGFFIAAIVITTIIGVFSIPFGLVYLFWNWFFKKVNAPV